MTGRTFSKSLNPIGAGPDVTGYVKGVTEYLEADDGADSTAFDVDAVISTAWESVGPTGSGATNIWTALDVVPNGAKWVELKISNLSEHSSSSTTTQLIYGRKTGTSGAIAESRVISKASMRADGSTYAAAFDLSTAKVPVDSLGRFDLYRNQSIGTGAAVLIFLIGWGI